MILKSNSLTVSLRLGVILLSQYKAAVFQWLNYIGYLSNIFYFESAASASGGPIVKAEIGSVDSQS